MTLREMLEAVRAVCPYEPYYVNVEAQRGYYAFSSRREQAEVSILVKLRKEGDPLYVSGESWEMAFSAIKCELAQATAKTRDPDGVRTTGEIVP